ncbi:IST1 homolog [Sycon ciliatum]|uniref:IST1 homolog n=1 Tax=Sycon ciliatum TaxID=27933 RepID=UPI0031F6E68C
MFGGGHKSSKLKIDLRLCINRLKLAQKKKTEQTVKARKEIADYLTSGKYERARIRVEHIIREDYIVEAMEVVELYCDLLLARFGLIESMKHCDEGLAEAVCSLIWVTPRMQSEINELKGASEQLVLKYGKTFGEQARANATNSVNERLVHRMSVEAPPKVLVEQYLVEIAKSHHVPYEADTMALMGNDFSALADDQEFIPTALPTIPSEAPGAAAAPAMPPAHSQPAYPMHPTGHPAMPPAAHMPPNTAAPGYPASSGAPTTQSYPYEPPRAVGPAAGAGHGMPVPPPGTVAGAWVAPGAPPAVDDRAGPLPSKADMAAREAGYPAEPSFELPSVPGDQSAEKMSGVGADSADLDFDDLTRRFEDLKRRK